MASYLEVVEELVRDVSRKLFPNSGFSIRSLIDVSGQVIQNQSTVLIFQNLPDSKQSDQIDIPGTKQKILSRFSSIEDTFLLLENAEKDGRFTLNDQNITILKDIDTNYAWEIDHVWRDNGISSYGLNRPATILHYKIGRSVPYQILPGGGGNFDSLDDLIWFGLVAKEGVHRPQYPNRRFNEYGVHLIIPHWHAHIESLEVLDEKSIAYLGTDADASIWKHITLACKRKHDDGKFSPTELVAVPDDGIIVLENKEPDVSSVEITLNYNPDNAEVGFWTDQQRAEKTFSKNNQSLITHQTFDPQSNILKSKLLEPGTDSQGFEWAISVLMHLAGYRTEWWGYQGKNQGLKKKSNKYPEGVEELDVFAIDETGTILAIECTTSQGDIPKKIAATAARAVKLKKENPRSKRILPMLCTSLERDELIAAGYGAALTGQVRIMSKGDYRMILEMIVSGRLPSEIAEYITVRSIGI